MTLLWPTAALAAFGFGTWSFVTGFRSLRLQRIIETTPTAHARSLAMGLVELQGRVLGRSRVFAPFTARECAWWEVELQTAQRSRRGMTRWSTVHREQSGNPFYLEDETGSVLVYPQGAKLSAGHVVQEETGGLGVPEPYAGFMESRGLKLRQLWALGPMRFRERTLEQGTGIYVLGRACPKPQAVAVSMDDEVALEATGTDAIGARYVRQHDDRCMAVIRKGRRDPALLISDHSEKTMTMEYGLKAIAGLVGGPLMMMFAIWFYVDFLAGGLGPLRR